MMLKWEELVKFLHYDPDTGIFTRKINSGPAKTGDIAGSKLSTGYINIRIKGTLYKAHRLAWLYCFQEWPEFHLDHINRDTYDNRLDNLREVTNKENNLNRGIRSNNTTGFKGVSYKAKMNKYIAQIQLNGVKQYIGSYSTAEQASAAYEEKAKELFKEYRPINKEEKDTIC